MVKNINRLDRFLLTYQGNKYLETKKYFAEEIKTYSNYDVIAEPFCGIFGFSRAFVEINKDFQGEIWLNDLSLDLIDWIRRIKSEPEILMNDVEQELSNYTTDLQLTRDKKKSKILGNIASHRLGICNIEKGKTKIINYKEKIQLYESFFNKVKLFNMDCKDFLNMITNYKNENENKKVLVYFDPPYFNSCNTDYQKSDNNEDGYNDGTIIYIIIYEFFKLNKDCLMVINRIEFINYFFEEWRYKHYGGFYQNDKKPKRHIIYKN